MNIYSSSQIKEIEEYTVKLQNLTWSNLMNRAAIEFVANIHPRELNLYKECIIFCGPGNNGGDGIVVGKLISSITDIIVKVYCLDNIGTKSTLNIRNLKKATHINNLYIYSIDKEYIIPLLCSSTLLIDAIFGIGINRPLSSKIAEFMTSINKSKAYKIALDIPSGMYADKPNKAEDIHFTPDEIITFQIPKTSFFFSENLKFTSKCKIADIGLIEDTKNIKTTFHIIKRGDEILEIKNRPFNSYKTKNGKSMIIGGSKGMYGASILAAVAALRIGSGYVQLLTPPNGIPFLKNITDIMVNFSNGKEFIDQFPAQKDYTIGIGTGLGQNDITQSSFETFLGKCQNPLVIDADAINIIAKKRIEHLIPHNSILTPHIGEFKRLVGNWDSSIEKLQFQLNFSIKHKCILVVKGPRTSVTTPNGHLYFNTTGNPSLAVAGSGDVLTGIITGLLAQYKCPIKSAIQGVYIHGLAADIYVRKHHEKTLTASILCDYIDKALLEMTS